MLNNKKMCEELLNNIGFQYWFQSKDVRKNCLKILFFNLGFKVKMYEKIA